MKHVLVVSLAVALAVGAPLSSASADCYDADTAGLTCQQKVSDAIHDVTSASGWEAKVKNAKVLANVLRECVKCISSALKDQAQHVIDEMSRR
jgi:hypothetical protein